MSQLMGTFSVGHVTAWRELHSQYLYPYLLQRVHCLTTADNPPQENFSRCFFQQTANLLFVSSVIFSDEANFIEVASQMFTINRRGGSTE
jgi:hypothetical protein